MSSWLTLVVGFLAVCQGSMNKIVADRVGLSVAIFFNGIVVLSCACLAFLSSKNIDLLKKATFKPWFIIPGVCGFMIIMLLPYLISRVGSARTFIGMVVGQVLLSVAWDMLINHEPLVPLKVLGAVLTVAGVVCVTMA